MAARLHRFVGSNVRPSCTLTSIVESKYFTLIMLAVVVSNTIVMIFETYDDYFQEYYRFFLIAERIYLCIYIVECCFKLWVGAKRTAVAQNWAEFSIGFVLEILHKSLELFRSVHHRHQSDRFDFARIDSWQGSFVVASRKPTAVAVSCEILSSTSRRPTIAEIGSAASIISFECSVFYEFCEVFERYAFYERFALFSRFTRLWKHVRKRCPPWRRSPSSWSSSPVSRRSSRETCSAIFVQRVSIT